MAERLHPDNLAHRGSVYEQQLHARYAFGQPYIVGLDVLDVPCGTGWGTSLLHDYRSLTGIDIDLQAIAFARERYTPITFLPGSMTDLPAEAASTDVVICLEGLEHIYRSAAQLFLAEAHRVLREDGRLIVTVPLRDNNRHSGNPYHHYEYLLDEIRGLLDVYFLPETSIVHAGADAPTLWYIGKRRAQLATDIADQPSVAHIYQDASNWIVDIQSETGIRFGSDKPATLISTCSAILTLEGTGRLTQIDQSTRDTWRTQICACQDSISGFFADPLLATYPLDSGSHDTDYFAYQTTYFALQALDALDTRVPYRLVFLDAFADPVAVHTWLDALDWSNAWLESNRVMFVLACLIYRVERENQADGIAAYHAALDWIERAQDPEYGLWGRAAGSSLLNQMAAAYHLVPFFTYVHRPLNSVDQAIDAVLSLQQDDGFFAPTAGGGACEDLDAIDLLVAYSELSQHRATDVQRSLIRVFWAIWNAQQPDGGFGYSDTQPGTMYRFSGWEAMETDRHNSDTWATWFRLLSLATIQQRYPADLPDLGRWTFRRWPALGYHRVNYVLAHAEAPTARRWLRTLPTSAFIRAEKPLVSVVIPCYNLGVYLWEAIASALNQTSTNIEILVVDDGSTDAYTQLVLESISHPQLRILRQQNQGLPVARNAGIRAARAAYICCLDADDRLRRELFARALAVLESEPLVGFVSSFYQEFDTRHGELRYTQCEIPEMLTTNTAMVAAVFRRTAWEQAGGYCETLSGLHDWDLWIGMLTAGYQSHVIPEVLFEYRIRPGSMYTTSSQPETYARLVGAIVTRHESSYRKWHEHVVVGWARAFAELVTYARGQSELVRQLRFVDNQSHKDSLQGQIAGLISEVDNWRSIADKRQRWIEQLEAARDYHIQHGHKWQQAADELQVQFDQIMVEVSNWRTIATDRHDWIVELEVARDYHAQQASNWQNAAQEQQLYILQLEEERDRLRSQYMTISDIKKRISSTTDEENW